MKNPFQYAGVVSGDTFCNRKKELEDLLKATENGERLSMYSDAHGLMSESQQP
jgi:hypothetical protein